MYSLKYCFDSTYISALINEIGLEVYSIIVLDQVILLIKLQKILNLFQSIGPTLDI